MGKRGPRPGAKPSSADAEAKKKGRQRARDKVFGPKSSDLPYEEFSHYIDLLYSQPRPKSPTDRHLSPGYRDWLEKRGPLDPAQQEWEDMLARRKVARRPRETSMNIVRKLRP
jgi:hypothetical protein